MVAFLLGVWAAEPVVITAVVDAAVMLAVSLGIPVPDNARIAVDGLIAAIGVLIARSQVASPATVATTAAAATASTAAAVARVTPTPGA